MSRRQLLPFSFAILLGISPLVAASPAASTLTISLSGIPGPLLAGSDPLNIEGQNASVTVTASESLKPKKQASDYVSYSLPSGSVSVSILGIKFPNTSNATMDIKLTPKADILTVTAPIPLGAVVTLTAFLAPGSWTTSVFKNPAPFSPSPQNLTAAAVAKQAGSQVKYSFLGSVSILGLTGTASNSSSGQ